MVALAADPNFHVRLAVKASARTRDPWAETRRANQIAPPGNWRHWLVMAGRGFGKSRLGAEQTRMWIQEGEKRLALIGPTMADVRDVMVEGESGLQECCHRYGMDSEYIVSKRRVEFQNGAKAFLYSADEPNRLRGPQHSKAWCDEIGAWRYGEDAWANMDMGLRLGDNPQSIATSTPRITKLVRDLVKRAGDGDVDIALTRGTTWDNRGNLPEAFIRSVEARYAGTRLGRQELAGEFLEDVDGALWTLAMIEANRLTELPDGVSLDIVAVGVDPSASSGSESAETGIVVAARGSDGIGYVLADCSVRGTPLEWGTAAVNAYREHRADHVTPEVNNGGEMVTFTLRTIDPDLPISPVYASRGKATRAEPVSALYEQGRVRHIGTFPQLEDQMTTWVPGQTSPDRMDALVWALTDVMLDSPGTFEELPEPLMASLAGMGIG